MKVIGNKDDNINENNSIDDGFIFTKGKTFTKHLVSLSQNNLIQYKYLWETNRKIPQEIKLKILLQFFLLMEVIIQTQILNIIKY
jgi:hypothetical protein